MFAPPLMKTLALAGLMVPAALLPTSVSTSLNSLTSLASLAQDAGAASLEQRFAAWKLRAATGVPGPAALQEIEGLIEAAESTEVSAGSPQLLATLTASAASLRARLQPAPMRAGPMQASQAAEKEVLRLALEKAMVENDGGFILALGARAVPVLREMAAAWDGAPPTGDQKSALHWLGELSRTDALDVALELMRSKSFLVKRGTLRTLSAAGHFHGETAWVPEGETDWRLAKPEWEEILHLALEEPAVEPSALKGLFEGFLRRGQLPRSMGRMAVEAGVNPRLLDVVPSEGRWYFEAMARSTDERLRREGAERLLWYGNNDLVVQLATDPSVRVRRALADSLLIGEEDRWVDREQMIHESLPVKLNVDSATLKAFELLARESGADVRRSVSSEVDRYLDTLEDAPFTGEQLAYLFPLITDPSINQNLARSIQRLPEAERLPAVAAMIQSFGERGAHLKEYLKLDPNEYGLSRKDDFFTLLDLWQAAGFFDEPEGTDRPRYWDVDDYLNYLVREANLDPEPFIERAVAWGWMDLLSPKEKSNFNTLTEWVDALSDEASLKLIRTIFAAEEGPDRERLIEITMSSTSHGLIESPEVLRGLIEDPTAHQGARIWAMRSLVRTHAELVDRPMLVTFAKLVAGSQSVSDASFLETQLAGAKGEEFIRLLAAEPEATPDQFLCLKIDTIEESTLEAVWPRVASVSWSEVDGPVYGVWGLTVALAKLSTERLDPRLENLDYSIKRVCEGLFWAARDSKNPVLLPLIRRVMLRPEMRDDGLWREATLAVGAYMNDEAAAILLEAAKKAPHARARTHAMAALEEITKWREAAAAWEKSSGATAKRAQAIAELIAILDDAQQPVESRAAALRGLGLLQAAEELPRIVRALTSKEGAIQEAARAAMARLEKGD